MKEIALAAIEKSFFEKLAAYPNITHSSVPVGKDESGNIVLYMVGEKPVFDFKVKNHAEIGSKAWHN